MYIDDKVLYRYCVYTNGLPTSMWPCNTGFNVDSWIGGATGYSVRH